MHVHLVVVELATKPHGMCTDDLRNVVAPMVGCVVLFYPRDRNTHHETVEDEVLNAFKLRPLNDNARRAGTGHETLRRRADTCTAMRSPHVVGISRHTEMKFIDRIGSPYICIAQGGQLSAALGQ